MRVDIECVGVEDAAMCDSMFSWGGFCTCEPAIELPLTDANAPSNLSDGASLLKQSLDLHKLTLPPGGRCGRSLLFLCGQRHLSWGSYLLLCHWIRDVCADLSTTLIKQFV